VTDVTKNVHKMTGNNIKAILFDFMGVLLFKRNNYVPDSLVDEIDNIIGSVTNDQLFEEETCRIFHLTKTDFDDILDKVVNKYEPYQLLWDLLPNLRMNYKLAIVNNGTGLTLSKFKSKLDIDTKFDAFISSAIEGIKKPDAEIYLLSAEKLGVKPNECLFMDDSYKNIEGARQAGMTTLWWDKNKERSEILKEFVNLASIF
jgi:epoxide hydrolase-like predicted phosphatase